MTQTIAELITDMEALRARLADGTARNPAGDPATGDVDAAMTALDGAIELLSESTSTAEVAAPELEAPYAIVDAEPGAPDDLRNIRGISSATASALTGLGITRYAHIAGLTARDVKQLKTDLGYRCTIGRDNWIEQAAMLEHGQSTSFSRRGAPASLSTTSQPIRPLPIVTAEPDREAPVEAAPSSVLTEIETPDRAEDAPEPVALDGPNEDDLDASHDDADNEASDAANATAEPDLEALVEATPSSILTEVATTKSAEEASELVALDGPNGDDLDVSDDDAGIEASDAANAPDVVEEDGAIPVSLDPVSPEPVSPEIDTGDEAHEPADTPQEDVSDPPTKVNGDHIESAEKNGYAAVLSPGLGALIAGAAINQNNEPSDPVESVQSGAEDGTVIEAAATDNERVEAVGAADDAPRLETDETDSADLPNSSVEEPDVATDESELVALLEPDDKPQESVPINGNAASMATDLSAMIAGAAVQDNEPFDSAASGQSDEDISPAIEEETSDADAVETASATDDAPLPENDETVEDDLLRIVQSTQDNEEDDVFAVLPDPVAVLAPPSAPMSVAASSADDAESSDAIEQPEEQDEKPQGLDEFVEPTMQHLEHLIGEFPAVAPTVPASTETVRAASGLDALFASVRPQTETEAVSEPQLPEIGDPPFAPSIRETSQQHGAPVDSAVTIQVSDDRTTEHERLAEEDPESSALTSALRDELDAQFAPIIQTSENEVRSNQAPVGSIPPRPPMAERLGPARATIDPLPEPFSPHRTAVDEAEIVIVRDGESDAPNLQIPELTDRNANSGLVGRITRMFGRKS